MNQYSIVLADDHVMFRQGIRNFIEKIDNMYISGEVNDGLELLDLLKTSLPDLIILDIAMPNLRGLEALREVRKYYPQVKVLILTMHGKKEFIRQAITDGANGFILKEEPSTQLSQAIEAIRNGKEYFSSLLSSTLTSLIREDRETQFLTKREKEILKFMAKGMNPQEISGCLFISTHTVRRHRHNIMQKLNITRMADLIKYAIAQGYTD